MRGGWIGVECVVDPDFDDVPAAEQLLAYSVLTKGLVEIGAEVWFDHDFGSQSQSKPMASARLARAGREAMLKPVRANSARSRKLTCADFDQIGCRAEAKPRAPRTVRLSDDYRSQFLLAESNPTWRDAR